MKKQLLGYGILGIGKQDCILIPNYILYYSKRFLDVFYVNLTLTETSETITKYDEEYDYNDYTDIRGLHVTFGLDDDHIVPSILGVCFCISIP